MAGVMTSFLHQKKSLDTSQPQASHSPLTGTLSRGLADAAAPGPASGAAPASLRAVPSGPQAAASSSSDRAESSHGLSHRPSDGPSHAQAQHQHEAKHGLSHRTSHGHPRAAAQHRHEAKHGLSDRSSHGRSHAAAQHRHEAKHASSVAPHSAAVSSSTALPGIAAMSHDAELEELLAFNGSQQVLLNTPATARKQRHMPRAASPDVGRTVISDFLPGRNDRNTGDARRTALRYDAREDSSEVEERQHVGAMAGASALNASSIGQQQMREVVLRQSQDQEGLITPRGYSLHGPELITPSQSSLHDDSAVIPGHRRLHGAKAVAAGGNEAGDLLFTPRQKRAAADEEEEIDLVSPDGSAAHEFELDVQSQSPAKRYADWPFLLVLS